MSAFLKFKPGGGLSKALLGAVLATALPTAAFASTAANTQIVNSATVTYNDAGGAAQTPVSATATVTVTLVPSAVTLSSPPNQTIPQGTSATLSYTITCTANGQDTYDLSSVATPTDVSAVTVTLPSSITLGGTTLAADATDGATTISVPYDQTNNSDVNGLVAGDKIAIGGNVYTIDSITENSGGNASTITLTTAISGGTVAAGAIACEQKTFSATVPSGTITSGNTGNQSVSTTAKSQTNNTQTTTQTTPTVVTVNKPSLTVSKLVSVDGGATFAATGNAAPGTTLIYKIVASNTGATDAKQVAFTDQIPEYLSYVVNSGKYATSSSTTYASATALTDGSGGYTVTTNSGVTTVAYDPGDPVGTVAGSGELVLFFEATIE